MVPILERYAWITPAVAYGEDAPIALAGPADATGWTLEARASFVASGPPDALLSAVTVSYVGGTDHTIRVTIPAASSKAAGVAGKETIYVEIWRVDSGNTRPLRRLAIPVYDPVRDAP